MDTFIARQTVARRRRPYSPLPRKPEVHASFFGGFAEGVASEASQKPRKVKTAPGFFASGSLFRAHGKSAGHATAAKRRGLFQGLSGALGHMSEALASVARRKRPEPRPNQAFESLSGIGLLSLPPSLSDEKAEKPAFLSRFMAKATEALAKRRGLVLGCGAAAIIAAIGLGLAVGLKPSFPLPDGKLLPVATDANGAEAELLLSYVSPEADDGDPDLAQLPLPKSLDYSSYTVKSNDSIGSIAKRFGRSVDSIVSANGIKSIKALRVGTELRIPNMDGLVHRVAKGESLGGIARAFKVEPTLLADANDLGSASLQVGQSLFIPGAKLAPQTLRQIYGTTVIWPARGPISSPFGYRADPFTGVRRFHEGLDIVVNMGTPVKAAMDGKIADLGWNANFGNYIIMSHGNGLQTLYGHLSAFKVSIGQAISQGTVIAASGNTGYSTGPHLHFGVYRNGQATNPLKLLK
jgi:murein DD-endopeptidase MepM/ murein hydrolase activator NlpD